MNCEVTRRWLDAYLDGELELTQQLTFLPVHM
jgi:predicted anti-sigma-YlaC factor YlaD